MRPALSLVNQIRKQAKINRFSSVFRRRIVFLWRCLAPPKNQANSAISRCILLRRGPSMANRPAKTPTSAWRTVVSKISQKARLVEHALLEIPEGHTEGWVAREDGELTLQEGRLWITRPGDGWDYWVSKGERLRVRAGERLLMGADRSAALAIVRFGPPADAALAACEA
jgi:hypothetical protein